jgi:hypothetical protein
MEGKWSKCNEDPGKGKGNLQSPEKLVLLAFCCGPLVTCSDVDHSATTRLYMTDLILGCG